MHKSLTTLLVVSLCLAGGCGGDDSSSDEPAKAPPKTEKAAPAATSGEVPTYEQVKALALKDPKVAKLCAGGGEDRKIGVSAKGETYTRLICDGNHEVFDHVVGKKGFADNYDASVKLATYDLWKLGSEAYVTAGLSGPKGLAAAIKDECGCGQTVKGGYGS